MKSAIEIGLFCGTFNPIHNAHLLLAQFACEQFKLKKIYFVTSPRPPHRQDVQLSGEKRFELASQAVANNDLFESSPIELERSGPSYTVDTIKYFAKSNTVNLLIGADNIIHLPTWYQFEEIAKLAKLLVAPRHLNEDRAQKDINVFTADELTVLSKTNYAVIDFPLIDISSSYIRQRIKEGRSVRYLVPEKVWQTIEREQYFK